MKKRLGTICLLICGIIVLMADACRQKTYSIEWPGYDQNISTNSVPAFEVAESRCAVVINYQERQITNHNTVKKHLIVTRNGDEAVVEEGGDGILLHIGVNDYALVIDDDAYIEHTSADSLLWRMGKRIDNIISTLGYDLIKSGFIPILNDLNVYFHEQPTFNESLMFRFSKQKLNSLPLPSLESDLPPWCTSAYQCDGSVVGEYEFNASSRLIYTDGGELVYHKSYKLHPFPMSCEYIDSVIDYEDKYDEDHKYYNWIRENRSSCLNDIIISEIDRITVSRNHKGNLVAKSSLYSLPSAMMNASMLQAIQLEIHDYFQKNGISKKQSDLFFVLKPLFAMTNLNDYGLYDGIEKGGMIMMFDKFAEDMRNSMQSEHPLSYDQLPSEMQKTVNRFSNAPNGCGYIDWSNKTVVLNGISHDVPELYHWNGSKEIEAVGVIWLDANEDVPSMKIDALMRSRSSKAKRSFSSLSELVSFENQNNSVVEVKIMGLPMYSYNSDEYHYSRLKYDHIHARVQDVRTGKYGVRNIMTNRWMIPPVAINIQEISHRSPAFIFILELANEDVNRLLKDLSLEFKGDIRTNSPENDREIHHYILAMHHRMLRLCHSDCKAESELGDK